MTPITIETHVASPIEKVWEYWTQPNHIIGWAFASPDWEAIDPENELHPGGRFKTTMSAKDGSVGFDFTGTYDTIVPYETINYTLDDDRKVHTSFAVTDTGVTITQTFDAEDENTIEMQQAGWQSILENFKNYTENN